MKLNKIVLAVIIALPTLLLAAGLASATENADSSRYMQAYDIPDAPLNIVVEAPGHVWFTLPAASAIGSLIITPTVTFANHATPTANSTPYDLVYTNGVIWFTERTGNQIGRLDVNSGVITEFAIPTANSEPTGIALAPDGTVWFVERIGNKIGRFDPSNSSFQEYTYTTPNAQFEDIAVVDNTSVWVTAPNLDQVINLQISNNQTKFLSVFTTPQKRPTAIVIENSNLKLPWITSKDSNLIGRYAPGTLSLWRWFKIPTDNSGPVSLALQDNGNSWNFWFAQNTSSGAGQLDVRADSSPISTRDQRLLANNAQPWGIAVAADGHVWVAGFGNRTIIEWQPPYFDFMYLPAILHK